LLLLGALPLKALLFFALLLVFGLRARTGFLAGLSLATYSEFGLIVLQAAAQDGLLDGEWLVLSALAVALSFAVSAPLNLFAHTLYDRLDRWLSPLQKARRHPDDAPITFGGSEVLIVGMGRVGSGAYDFLHAGERQAVGIDSDPAKIQRHLKEGRRVVYADAEDPGFWERLNFSRLQAIMLAVPDLGPKLFASSQIRRRGFDGLLSATYVYPEELEQVLRAGCDVAYNYFTEAGVGFAAHTLEGLRAEGARREPTDTELARRLTT
jgi:voltage-gated potassium channel Kch